MRFCDISDVALSGTYVAMQYKLFRGVASMTTTKSCLPNTSQLFQYFDVLLVQHFHNGSSDFVICVSIPLLNHNEASTLNPQLFVKLSRKEAEKVAPICCFGLQRTLCEVWLEKVHSMVQGQG